MQEEKTFSGTVIKKVKLNYLIHLPKEYYQHNNKKWPMILFLHGIGERGEDLNLLKRNGIPKIVEECDDFPFITVSPQCPSTTMWIFEIDSLFELIKNIIIDYRVDIHRIYLTGLSMGGFGAWHLAESYPKIFAAVVPICGGTYGRIGFPERIRVLKDVPIWVFHGAKDDVIPIQASEELVEELKKVNANVKFTIYSESGHDVWTEVYNNKELYLWLLEQKNNNFNFNQKIV